MNYEYFDMKSEFTFAPALPNVALIGQSRPDSGSSFQVKKSFGRCSLFARQVAERALDDCDLDFAVLGSVCNHRFV